MVKKYDDTSELLGLRLFSREKSELLTQLEETLDSGKHLVILLTPNPEQIVQAKAQPELSSYFTQADYLIPDGVGLVWASKILAFRGKTQPLTRSIPGVDVVADVLHLAKKHHRTAMVVGGRGYSSTGTISYQELQISWHPGYAAVASPTQEEETSLKAAIQAVRPDVVFVAFGAPHQERWIFEHKELLEESGVKVVMSVGGSFDYLLGKVPRAPKLVRSLGFEWLYRLVRQPWRWQRQTRLISFVGIVLKELLS